MTTRAEWAEAFLGYAGWEVSREKIDALVAQTAKEDSGAAWNPLDTEEGAPGATNYNPQGVKNYPSEDVGFGATLATFTNGHYPQLVAILSDPSGGSAASYCASPDLNTWGTGNCTAELEQIRAGAPLGNVTVAGSGGGDGPAPGPAPAPAPTPLPPEVNTLDDLTFIRWCFQTLLERVVDPGAYENFNNYLAAGGTREAVYESIQNSDEYKVVNNRRRKTNGLSYVDDKGVEHPQVTL